MSGKVTIRVNQSIQNILDQKVDKGGNNVDTGQTLRDSIDANVEELIRLAGICLNLNPVTNEVTLTDGNDAILCDPVDFSNFRGVDSYTDVNSFPTNGVVNTLYVDESNDHLYIWNAEILQYKNVNTLTAQEIINSLGYTPEDTANKATDFNIVNDVLFPTVKAVEDRLNALVGEQWNKKIYYKVRHNSGLNFTVTSQWRINGVTFNPSSSVVQSLTLSDADTLYRRFDMFVLNDDGTIGVIEGTPAENPKEPALSNPERQLKGSFISISANATEPDGFTTIKIYDENTGTGGGEFLAEKVPGGNPRIDLANAADPSSGSVAIDGTNTQQYDAITFTPSAPFSFSEGGGIIYRLKNKATYNGTQPLFSFQLFGLDSNGVMQSVMLSPDNIYDRSNTTQYQLLHDVIPQALPFQEISYLQFVILAKNNQNFSFYLDDIYIVEGTGDTVSNPNISEEYIRIQDEKYLELAKAYADSVGDKHFVHDQGTPSMVWGPINHKLGKYPSIRTMDTSGNEIIGELNDDDLNNTTITFNSAVAGKAYFN